MKIEFIKFKQLVANSGYSINGSLDEQRNGSGISQKFPNSEQFWKNFIVPITNRIDLNITDFHAQITPRDEVSDQLREIGSIHFSIFQHLVYAHAALKFKHPAYFENFYTHLGTVCDCVEDFLTYIYFLINECTEARSDLIQNLNREKFLNLAGEWYDSNYGTLHEFYLAKGKSTRITIPTKLNVLKEYYQTDKTLKAYITLSQAIRQYRNTVVHNYSIAGFLDEQGTFYVPRKEVINKYKSWKKVYEVDATKEEFRSNFIDRELQMHQDLDQLQLRLQALWHKPINDMNALLYVDRNLKLLSKYRLEFL